MQPEPDTQIVPPRGGESGRAPDTSRKRNAGGDREPALLRRWVGRYELIHRLAHGGMATVYLGRAKGKAGFEKVVAVKVIHPHLASEAEFVGMFLDEARIAARLHHPHIVEILDLGEFEGVHFMVMEFIEGDNLAALGRALGGERLPISVILCLLTDTLEGLGAAHGLCDGDGEPYRLVHRDVSPHNILINLDGWAKVGDFGIMKAAGKASNTKTGELRGKLAYMSPEQARGVDLDLRTDLFAVGVITWELLTGRRLFACDTEAATLERVMSCKVPAIDFEPGGERGELSEVPELVEGLRGVLTRTLDADPDRRYSDTGEMLAEVKRLARVAEQLSDCPEPRAYLGALMTRFFKTRVEYARAALRRTGAYEALGLALAKTGSSASEPGRDWAVEPTLQVGPDSGPVPLPAEMERRGTQTDSQTPVPLPMTGSHPSVVAPQGVGQWTLWLVLPMVGAALAIMAMMLIAPFDRGGEQDRKGGTAPEQPAAQAEVPRPATEYALPPSREEVEWQFTTQPAGATVVVDGAIWAETTPTAITLPAGEVVVEVELRLDGHHSKTLRLKPLGNQNFDRRLEPLSESEAPKEPPSATDGKRPRTKKAKGSKDSTPPEDGDGKPGGKAFLPAPDALKAGSGG